MTRNKPLPTRGYMLDLSRDKVPTLATLFALIEDLAALDYNQLQLYTEHTFAFPGHEVVWGRASPLTPGDIRALDQKARERGIELVPCLNTMGHWERWLQHPEYFQYAECPYGWRRPDGHGMPHGSTLTPSNESLALLDALMTAYLPLFSSNKVNIGGDEPWELGMGRARERCETEGRHTVYLAFLRRIIALAKKHKEVVMFWGDILLERPDLWFPPEPDTIALIWGYEAGHPFPAHIEALAKQGQPCLLCPGTSTWNSLGGRLANALENIAEAAACARRYETEGLLLTDWGDHGHHQPPVLSAPALLAAAEQGWQGAGPAEWKSYGKIAAYLPLLEDLGELYLDFAFQPPNRLPLIQALTSTEENLPDLAAPITRDELAAAERRLASLQARFSPPDPDALAAREIALVLHLHAHAIRRLLAAKGAPGISTAALRSEFTALIGEFEALWLRRNRPGGLWESSARLRRALDSYPTEPSRRPPWPPPG